VGLALLLLVPSLILFSLPSGVMQGLGWILILLELAFSSLGAAGLAREIGSRLALQSTGSMPAAGSFLRGAVALELAVIFPLVGWLVVFPIATLASFGAAFSALHPHKQLVSAPVFSANDSADVKVPTHDALSS
jgi:hypothetical protein